MRNKKKNHDTTEYLFHASYWKRRCEAAEEAKKDLAAELVACVRARAVVAVLGWVAFGLMCVAAYVCGCGG